MTFDLDLYLQGHCLGLGNRVHSVPSTVHDGFFPNLVQMITSMRRCVACDDLWPWPISSRSFNLDFKNHVGSVTLSVLDQLFPYLPQIITTITGCVTCYFYNKILIFQFFANFSAFTLKKNLQFCLHSFHIGHKSSLASESVAYNDLYLPWYKPDRFHICISYRATWEGVPRVKVIV